MDFRLSQEQQLLRDSAQRYFAGAGRVAAASAADDWPRFAEFGWTAMPVPEDSGGLGAPLEDLAILCEQFGRVLSRAPFIGGAVLPARMLAHTAAGERRAEMLSAIASGSMRIAAAIYEPGRRYELLPATRASRAVDGRYRLSGSKSLVTGGAQAERLIVTALIDGDGDTTALFAVDANQPGVQRRIYRTLDDVEVADFEFAEVVLSPDALLPAPDMLEDALDEALLCLCAETLGAIDRAIDLSVEYLKLRQQFGRALAEFQVLQHNVAEMWIDANSARSIFYRAMAAMGATMQTPRAERRRAVSGCFVKVMQAAKSVAGSAVHLHGGIGMSCEYPVGHYLRRVLVSERIFGDCEWHLARCMR